MERIDPEHAFGVLKTLRADLPWWTSIEALSEPGGPDRAAHLIGQMLVMVRDLKTPQHQTLSRLMAAANACCDYATAQKVAADVRSLEGVSDERRKFAMEQSLRAAGIRCVYSADVERLQAAAGQALDWAFAQAVSRSGEA